ncbi:MAG: NUDIX domain-containing protein [Defluviitaleaceae bacterium]|nr:NUDIX domain-containing protein [Defluviitaleaceae bacterium]
MKTIMLCERDEYEQLPRRVVNAVKAIIIKDDKIGLIHFKNDNLYDLPGGGIEDGETPIEALVREIKEEAGATVKLHSIREFENGKYVLIYKNSSTNTIIERNFTCFYCAIEDIHTQPQLTDYEHKTSQQFVFVTIDDAIAANDRHMQQGRHWVENPTIILRRLKDIKAM